MNPRTNIHLLYIDYHGVDSDILTQKHEDIATHAAHYWRFDTTLWIVASTFSAQEWIEKLQLTPPEQTTYEGSIGHSMVIKVDSSDRYGFMTKEFWDWFDKIGAQNVIHLKV